MVAKRRVHPAQQLRPVIKRAIPAARRLVAQVPGKPCDDSCALNAFQQWHDAQLTPSFNYAINFSVPTGKRMVIEFVTATIEVPAGESARLRMYTGIGTSPSNFDLVVTPQGLVGGRMIYIATHSFRAYADTLLEFNINRDNATTSGYALICVSGYLV